MSSLSVIVIAKNEEHNIRECLNGVAWAREIIVVDGGSSDRTVELAREVGARVYARPWDGYGAAKNFALSQCSSKWVLWLDADERVSAELAAEIQALISQEVGEFNGYEVARRAFFLGKWIKHCGWYPGYVSRLFVREAGRFTENKVHERLELKGKVGTLKSDLLHYTDPNLFHYVEKLNRYTSLAAEELYDDGQRFGIGQLVFRPIWVFVRMYVIQRGFLDGIQGFILCVLSACYVFTKYAKFWEYSSREKRSSS